MVPTARDEGKKHEVASFDTVAASVAYYILTLNSHPAYQELRERRTLQRSQNKPVNGWELAGGLLNYSERREAYVEEIRDMISYNKLQQYTTQ